MINKIYTKKFGKIMIEQFEKIVENKKTVKIQGQSITVENAKSVINAYKNLSEQHRLKFIKLPIQKILEFVSQSQQVKEPTGLNLKGYMADVEKPVEQKVEDVSIENKDDIDLPDENIPYRVPVLENEPIQTPVIIEKIIEKPVENIAIVSKPQEDFYNRLLEQFDIMKQHVEQPLSITVETMEPHIEKLVEFETFAITTLEGITEFIENSNNTTKENIKEMCEYISENRQMIIETQQTSKNVLSLLEKFSKSQQTIVETQTLLAKSMVALTEKITTIVSNPPKINFPIPGKIVKLVERNEEGFITKIIEQSN